MSRPTDNMRKTEETGSAASRLFDFRVLIGVLFTFYGIVLIITGVMASSSHLHRASDINSNLPIGIGMLVIGLIFLAWWRLRPLRQPK